MVRCKWMVTHERAVGRAPDTNAQPSCPSIQRCVLGPLRTFEVVAVLEALVPNAIGDLARVLKHEPAPWGKGWGRTILPL